MLYRGATLLIVTTIAVATGINTPAQAQPAPPPMFENVTLDQRFSSVPIVVKGISGGSLAAKQVAGRVETANGACAGFVNRRPDHTLVLKAFFDYLRLQVQSPKDTTIVVSGPGGSWCNDDAQGKNPGISGQWLAGKYSIWVGSYDQTKYYPYILRISK